LWGRGRGFPAQIQTPITTLQTILQAQASYKKTNGLSAETAAYEREIADAHRLSKSLGRQVELYEKELGYQQKQADRMLGLGKDGIVSTQEVEQAAAQTVGARRQREVLVSSDIQNQLRVQQLRQQILQRRLAHREQLADFERQLLVQLKLLRTALDEFRDRYVLIARESGTLSWQPSVRAQAMVGPAEPIGYLLPADGDDKVVARLQLPSLGQGKISLGDKVILDFSAYPSREYGQVEGKLASLAPVALPDQNGQYLRLATVALPDTLLTSYGKTLPFRYNLSGSARVITAERTLLQRLLDQFLNLTQNT
jgi:multidrug resistance efflux pump